MASSPLVQQFQRELNRLSDSDRMVRKRGLQNLLDELPWPKTSSSTLGSSLPLSGESSMAGIIKSVKDSKKKKSTIDGKKVTEKKVAKEGKKSTDGDDVKKVSKKETKEVFATFLQENLIPLLIPIFRDPIEKCREISLILCKNSLLNIDALRGSTLEDLVATLSSRLNENPFPETSEELRLHCIELLSQVLLDFTCNSIPTQLFQSFMPAIQRSLGDSFPAVKRASSDLIISLCERFPKSLQMYVTNCIPNIVGNLNHQHSKIRNISIKAWSRCVSCLGETEYAQQVSDSTIGILKRITSEVQSSKIEVIQSVLYVITKSIRRVSVEELSVGVDVNAIQLTLEKESLPNEHNIDGGCQLQLFTKSDNVLVHLLFLFVADLESDATNIAKSTIASIAHYWSELNNPRDAERNSSSDMIQYLEAHFHSILYDNMILGSCDWNIEMRTRYVRAIRSLFDMLLENGSLTILLSNQSRLSIVADDSEDGSATIVSYLFEIINLLVSTVKEPEPGLRQVAFDCCERLAHSSTLSETVALLLQRICGNNSGLNNPTQRCYSLLVLANVVKGIPKYYLNYELEAANTNSNLKGIVSYICSIFSAPDIYDDREDNYREALLLLLRYVILNCSDFILDENTTFMARILVALVFLHSKLSTESDALSLVASRELYKLALLKKDKSLRQKMRIDAEAFAADMNKISFDAISKDDSTRKTALQLVESQLIAPNFSEIFGFVVFGSLVSDAESGHRGSRRAQYNTWTQMSSSFAAFRSLLALGPRSSWEHFEVVGEVIEYHVKPPSGMDKESHESHLKSYASIQGEETFNDALVDTRLGFLLSLDTLIQLSSQDWECSALIAKHSQFVFEKVLLPNLIWRVGRVEATVRKVALAATYALLRAGAVKPQTLFAVASHLVPSLVGSLDDFESSLRHLSTLSLAVVFHRLRGAFGHQAVSEIYPKLLARLDDSEDRVRQAMCSTLSQFLQSATPDAFSGTTLDYTLDQLFIHLDDNNPEIQDSVFEVIKVCVSIDKELVKKKSNSNRCNHRNPTYCDKLLELCK